MVNLNIYNNITGPHFGLCIIEAQKYGTQSQH